jgi:hypothetical protein
VFLPKFYKLHCFLLLKVFISNNVRKNKSIFLLGSLFICKLRYFRGIIFLCFFPNREEKEEEPDLPRYRDRAKERREDQNPDYEPTDMGSLHAVAPPGTVDLR